MTALCMPFQGVSSVCTIYGDKLPKKYKVGFNFVINTFFFLIKSTSLLKIKFVSLIPAVLKVWSATPKGNEVSGVIRFCLKGPKLG